MMPGRGEQSGIIWGGEIYERTERTNTRIFLKVCETGSFSGAAEALNYTQLPASVR